MTLPTPWLDIAPDSDFSLYNLPFGIFSHDSEPPGVGVAVGEWIIDMAAAARAGALHLGKVPESVYRESTLNAFMALGRPAVREVRNILQEQLTQPDSALHRVADRVLVRQAAATMHLPVAIGDYTDFYSSLEHATNVGKLFRPENPLLPNWKHLPVAYHGRASSIVVSGTPIHRPNGQTIPAGATNPVFGPSEALDFELELGFLIGKDSAMGIPVSTYEAEEYLFGCVLFNDWSARDIQRWEYQPLGPFLSKNFASSVSPWVVTMDALEDFRVSDPEKNPEPLPYLRTSGALNFDLNLEVAIKADAMETTVCRTNARHLYWNIRQQIAHHTVTGCNLRVGDLLATGTISGPEGSGCLLELTDGGKKQVRLSDGSERIYLQDGDEVIIRGFAERKDARVGFGEVRGAIRPAQSHFAHEEN
ncbi:fumarylacetoacetase [Persicitalea jodogahamensis]|uniref:fumarylacetoacetase n=1 Tax=Persicitalea jodogahamensis TaxID=402147 RepID=A0A8J3DDW8_9BACT|nr:fumarylacetoacetase [Persicitalea jodogahamensis]GHB88607.1 fumarylacetoacetase [Persicitalea jodogahamensis]